MAPFVDVRGCWSVDRKKILQGPNSAPLSETMVEDLCHRRALSISLAVTHTVSLSQGSRMEKFKKQEDLQPEVQVCRVQEQVAEPLHALCFQHCAVTPLPPQREESHPNTGSITCYIINMLCPHCIWLSSHFGSTFVPSSRTDLAYAHTCFCTTASHS